MFGKSDLVDNLSRDLSRARDKRDAHRNCHSPSLDLPSCCKIVIVYSVFQNGCLAASRQR
jgi:hypothetical protein